MKHRHLIDHEIEYDFAPDDPPLVSHRHWVIGRAQLIDDITETPLGVPFRARVVLPGVQIEVAQDGTRVPRLERGIAVNQGADGTFALVAQPWLRFTPFAAPTPITVLIEADGYVPQRHDFAFAYDQRTIALPAPAVNDRVVTLNSTAGLVAGQTLLFGPATAPQYVRIQTLGLANQLTLEAGLQQPQVLGNPVFPDAFAAPPPDSIALRRASVRILGRVVNRDTSANVSTPVANASIVVTDFWRTRAAVMANTAHGSMTDPVPALRQFAVSVTPGALATRAVGAPVGTIALPVVVGDDRVFARPIAAGEAAVRVTTGQNLLPPPAPLANRLLLIAPDDPLVAEYQTIATLELVGAVDEPAELGFDLPLCRAHREGTRVTRINAPLALPPTPQALRDATAPGDYCLFLDDVSTLATSGTLRLTGGGAADEFQRYAQLAVKSDADGYFRLPPLQRMARVAITIDDGLGHVQTIELDPQYGVAEQRIDVVYPV